MTPDERWLAAVWPVIRTRLPAAPASVVEVGCGPLGGFVPMLRRAGYQAMGVDPQAPLGSWYCRAAFEHYDVPEPVGVIVACTSLHHVAGLDEVLDLISAALAPGGLLVVVEWARERFDDATARWCFDRLPPPGSTPGWLRQRCTEWRQSGQPWPTYCRAWAEAEGVHAGREIISRLRVRFDSEPVTYGPYFFPDLEGASEADEQAAIDRGQIQAGRIHYLGRQRPPGAPG